ncbi:MAG: hypothetical protein WC805_03885 [Patescibacteria group bacterium]
MTKQNDISHTDVKKGGVVTEQSDVFNANIANKLADVAKAEAARIARKSCAKQMELNERAIAGLTLLVPKRLEKDWIPRIRWEADRGKTEVLLQMRVRDFLGSKEAEIGSVMLRERGFGAEIISRGTAYRCYDSPSDDGAPYTYFIKVTW